MPARLAALPISDSGATMLVNERAKSTAARPMPARWWPIWSRPETLPNFSRLLLKFSAGARNAANRLLMSSSRAVAWSTRLTVTENPPAAAICHGPPLAAFICSRNHTICVPVRRNAASGAQP